MTGLVLLLGVSAASPSSDDTPLNLVDLPEYRAALDPDADGPAAPVGFRDLWDHPDRHRGRRVQVEGRVVRRFQQAPVGLFPALIEDWIATPSNDVICLVYPEPTAGPLAAIGTRVRFAGTFLRRVQYEARDVSRLAPLIVGGGPPIPLAAAPAGRSTRSPFSRLDWTIGAIVAALVASILVRQLARRPPRRRADFDPPPRFVREGEAAEVNGDRIVPPSDDHHAPEDA